MISLREFQESDVSSLPLLKRRAVEHSMPYKVGLLGRNQDEEEQSLRDVANRCTILVADVDGKIAGFAAFEDSVIEQMYIDPEYQNQGIGSELMRYMQSLRSHLRLWVDNENKDAMRFYERHGFVFEKSIDHAASEYLWFRR